MDRVASLVERIKGQANQTSQRQPELMVDATGVGLGVVETKTRMRRAGPQGESLGPLARNVPVPHRVISDNRQVWSITRTSENTLPSIR